MGIAGAFWTSPVARAGHGLVFTTRSAITRLLDDVSAGQLGELMLTKQDFPSHYVDMAHPMDYHPKEHPLQPELFYHNGLGSHFRLLLRASVALSDKSFLPMTFVCNTAFPGGFYFSERAMGILSNSDTNRMKEHDLGSVYLQTGDGKFAVTDTPQRYQPANVLGLRVLEKYGLVVSDTPHFGTPFEYF